MNLTLSGKTRNLIFYVLLCLGVVCFVVTGSLGSRQDTRYTSDYSLFQQGNSMVAQGNYVQAGQILGSLLETHPDSYLLMWQYAFCLSQERKFSEAEQYYTQARLQRPFVLEDPQFLYAAGLNYANLGQFAEARKYLARAQSLSTDKNLSDAAKTLLQQIDGK